MFYPTVYFITIIVCHFYMIRCRYLHEVTQFFRHTLMDL